MKSQTSRRAKPAFVVLAMTLVLGLVFAAVGCTAEQIAALKTSRDEAVKLRTATTQTAGDVQAELDRLPADDPVRKTLEPTLAKATKLVAQMDRAIAAADATIALAEKGDTTDPAVKATFAAIPYGSLVLAVLAGVGYVTRGRKISDATAALDLFKHAFGQVVQSVESVLPVKTAEQKQALSAVQDETTRRLVDTVKSS